MSSDLEDILAAFTRLVEEHEETREGAPEGEDPENFRCTDCVDCVACRFCTSCERCSNCTYCDACGDCADCTQSRECTACAECSHSSVSAYCEKSSYLTLCLDCDACVQCFACVGLSGAEFHILNQPYKRSAYFKKVAELRKLLDVKLTEGWMPPWVEEDEPEPTEEPDPVEEPEPVGEEPEPDPPVMRAATGVPTPANPETTLSGDPNTEVAELGAPRRVDPYTDRTSRLPDVASHTGSWPPTDAQTARSMDREARGNEPWEDLFEPDELPPPRPAAPKPEATTEAPKPRVGRFDRLVTPAQQPETAPEPPPPAPKPRDEPPPSFMGRVPSPPSPPSDPESTGSIRRAKRPRRD